MRSLRLSCRRGGLRRAPTAGPRARRVLPVPGRRGRDLFHDEEGFSTVGMALALLITLSLIFSAAQVYRVNARAADIQDVADAAALAAENEIAEFMIVVRVCDAVVLSLSLTGLAATGLGIAALCVPGAAGVSDALLKAGGDLMRARDAFAEKASARLDDLQKALPFIAAANAASVAQANGGDEAGGPYLALAVLLPAEGAPIAVDPLDGADDLASSVQRDAPDIKQAAEEAERAAERANAEKERAFEHDCGAAPSYCLYERASQLAGLDRADNPLYRSIDTWSFSVALKRAQAYYPARLEQEAPDGASVEERARSALRTRFYAFAAEEVGRGYVRESADSFDALFPPLPKNTDEMRATALYTEAAYPVTEGASGVEGPVMHAWAGCPEAAGAGSRGSIAQMEQGDYATCPACSFTASSMGKVAAASSSIENGFEHHYAIVAECAAAYQKAREAYEPQARAVKDRVGGLFDQLGDLLKRVGGQRIQASPPGGLGAVALVANTGSVAPSRGFESAFVAGTHPLGTRAAVSAATLLAEHSDEGKTVVSSLLDGIADRAGTGAVGVLGSVLGLWSSLLSVYAEGQEALDGAVREAADAVPLSSASGLGTWASGALRDVVAALGLEPAELDALKPALVNAAHVAGADDGAFAARLISAKQRALSLPGGSTDLFSSIVGSVEDAALEDIASFDGTVEIASIALFGEGGPKIPLVIALPPAVRDAAGNLVSRMADAVRGVYGSVTGIRVWE